jgi:hypothetical protein
MSGVFLRRGDELIAMIETPYEAESVLQELLASYPTLLSSDASEGENWLLIRREAGIGLGDAASSRGYLDHLFVDSAGVPTLVEVKRSSDTRIRREVVGQMLDYAANAAARWGGDTLQSWFEESCASRDEDPEQALLDAFPAVENITDFWTQVRTNLVAERLRLVFVADYVPSELRRIVEFLNGQMTQTEVLAIEVKQYRDSSGQHETLVPRVLGETEQAKQVKSVGQPRRWTRETILEQLREYRNDAEATLGSRLFDWVRARGDLTEWYGSGKKDGSFQAGYPDTPRYLFPFALYGYGRVEVQFQYMMRRKPFDREGLRRELLDKLNAIPGVELGEDTLMRRPSIQLETLLRSGSLEQFTSAMDWAFAEASAAAARSTPSP